MPAVANTVASPARGTGSAAALPYQAGFASLERETVQEMGLPVKGEFPQWLTGRLLRTAPCRYEIGRETYDHWFDGLAMLHRFAFTDGRVAYASRFLRGKAFREAESQGRICYGEFATDPHRTFFGRISARFVPRKLTDNGAVAVSSYGGRTVALTETPLPVIVDPETLETLGVFEFGPAIGGQLSTAHPHYDVARRCHYSFVVAFGRRSVYRLFSIAANGEQRVIAEMPVACPAYMHSFAMTRRYLILTEFPLVVSPLRLRFSGRPLIENYRWEPQRGLRCHVFDKETGTLVKTAETEAVFAFHHVNAFEAGETLCLDMAAYPDHRIIGQLYLERLRSGAPVDVRAMLTRYELPVRGAGAVTQHPLSAEPLELPRINYRACAGAPYRFVWGSGNALPGNFLDRLVKIDSRTGETTAWQETGCYPGEPVFIAAPAATAEDEGVLLSVVFDTRAGTSFLLALDAATLVERGRATVPHHIPFGFHGDYFPSTSDAALD
jgi:beta,beta-carotene 9',10'-dioxygenase